MSIVRSGISWCTDSWGGAVGCTNDCSIEVDNKKKSYCYARAMKRRFSQGCEDCATFKPHLHPKQFENFPGPRRDGKPRSVFIAPCAGLWEPGAFSDGKIRRVLKLVKEHPEDIFLTLTKKGSARYRELMPFGPPTNMWCGVTITTREEWDHFYLGGAAEFISFEPLLEDMTGMHHSLIGVTRHTLQGKGIYLAIIGPLNYRGKSPTKPEWILDLMKVCEQAGVMVHLKPQCESVGIPRKLIDEHQRTPWSGESPRT